jgi:hypothetical protein
MTLVVRYVVSIKQSKNEISYVEESKIISLLSAVNAKSQTEKNPRINRDYSRWSCADESPRITTIQSGLIVRHMGLYVFVESR